MVKKNYNQQYILKIMKTYKFRAWNTHLKTMQHNVQHLDSLNELMSKENYLVEQWTGLTDKNNVDIYEGDICKCRYYKHAEPDLYLTQIIVYEKGCFVATVNDCKFDLDDAVYSKSPLYFVDEIEVISNIHINKLWEHSENY
jgi:uncharacterized phage protein (TIGR01671 family)